MKRLMTTLARHSLIAASVAGLAACAAQPDTVTKYEPRYSSLSDSPTPYAVADADRTVSINRLDELRKELLATEGKMLAPAKEDLEQYADFLKAPNTGIARIYPLGSSKAHPILTAHGGSYYTFKTGSYDYGDQSLQYTYTYTISDRIESKPVFDSRFGGVDYAIFASLGKIDIRTIDLKNSVISFVNSQPSMAGQTEPHWREQQTKWQTGVQNNGTTYAEKVITVVGDTYVERAIHEGRNDTTTAFQVVRRDPQDDSLILVWMTVSDFAAPFMAR